MWCCLQWEQGMGRGGGDTETTTREREGDRDKERRRQRCCPLSALTAEPIATFSEASPAAWYFSVNSHPRVNFSRKTWVCSFSTYHNNERVCYVIHRFESQHEVCSSTPEHWPGSVKVTCASGCWYRRRRWRSGREDWATDDLRKSRRLHSVSACRFMPAGVAQSSHAFVGDTVSTWARWRIPVNKGRKGIRNADQALTVHGGTCGSDSKFPQLVVYYKL